MGDLFAKNMKGVTVNLEIFQPKSLVVLEEKAQNNIFHCDPLHCKTEFEDCSDPNIPGVVCMTVFNSSQHLLLNCIALFTRYTRIW